MTRVLILGAEGMLGSMVASELGGYPGLEVTRTSRRIAAAVATGGPLRRFDVMNDPIGALLDSDSYEWIINAVGVTKPHIDGRSAASIEAAIRVNAVFPHRLAAEAEDRGQQVIQIATDGVFAGTRGPYDESAPHDPVDVYGKTKSLGEVRAANVVHLRCSIIGPERSPPLSLLGWALSSEPGAELAGYTTHRWNGVTTLHFAKICAAVIGGIAVPSLQHVVPADTVTKAHLLELALSEFGRGDVAVRRDETPEPIDRTLITRDQDTNRRLWSGAGYAQPPTIGEMLHELAARRMRRVGGVA